MTTPPDSAWFDGDGRLTPDELQTADFPHTRLGRRGYEEEPVRGFLRVVHAEFLRLINERAALWQEVQRLRRRILSGTDPHDPHAILFGEQDAHVHAVRILSTAQVTADRYVADAQAYSSRLTKEARARHDDIVRQARQHSDTILHDAHNTARQAAVTALSNPPPPQTDTERQAAQAELAYLRTYSNVYRSHLRAYTEGILRGIDDWERNEQTTTQQPTTPHPNPHPAIHPAPHPTDQRSIGN